MPRVPPLNRREDLAVGDRAIFDEIARERGQVRGPFPVLLHSPQLCQKVAALGEVARFHNDVPKALNELAIITVGREYDCQYEFTRHVEMARVAGVREETIQAIAQRASTGPLSDDEKLIVRFTQEMMRNRKFTDATWNEAVQRFGVKATMDLTITVGYYVMMCHLLLSLEVTLPLNEKGELPGGR